MTSQQTTTLTSTFSGTPHLSNDQEERLLKKRLMDQKTKDSKGEEKDEKGNLTKLNNVMTKLMSYNWTFLDFVIISYFGISALSFARAFSSFMLMLPHSHGIFHIFTGIYWFICIYPTYKFFTNLNVRGAVLVHSYINLIAGGTILCVIGMTFWTSRYIVASYYLFYISLLFQSFIQFMSVIILSLFPFKVIRTVAFGKLSAKYSMKFSEAIVNSTIKTYKNATNYLDTKLT
ncbi:Hypothetical protein SRAE_1000089400 [Strongyloides ratti]|uniref:Transmembrane protein n=1 Tax=Strongyloides ratti TaxID=34506 RepID=A0A090L557_STRRB|nr:Hypothetical protein SRAE_1000089400 [Strongyloides ratti]CEF62624.1 Hypothetical protein SRAE_1000089400 [Strongyloides ratti]